MFTYLLNQLKEYTDNKKGLAAEEDIIIGVRSEKHGRSIALGRKRKERKKGEKEKSLEDRLE